MSETTNADVITVAPKSTGFSPLQSTDTVDDEKNKCNSDDSTQDCLAKCCLEVCTEPCAQMCAELIRFWCCLRCWADLASTSSGESTSCCCCDDCSGGECCGNCGDCGDICCTADLCTCCCEG